MTVRRRARFANSEISCPDVPCLGLGVFKNSELKKRTKARETAAKKAAKVHLPA